MEKIIKTRKLLLLPNLIKKLEEFGENIKLARLRRKMSTEQLAERANISRSTLWCIENGDSSVSIGAYIQVLSILGLEKNLPDVAGNDILGRKLQDIELLAKQTTNIEDYRKKCFKYHKKECIICKEHMSVDVHHFNENHEDNSILNLIPLCPTHHQYFHTKKLKYLIEPVIIEYINNYNKGLII